MKSTILSFALATTALAGAANAADLRMSWWGGDSRHLATQEALKICGEKHGHTIQPEFTGWGGHFEKVTTQIAGRTEADIMQINWPWLPIYSKNGDGFADLNDYADIIDLSQWTTEALDAGTMNGKLNGLSVSTTGRLFVFNKTTFDKAGIPLPTTWDELIAAGQTFKEKLGDDYYPFESAKLDATLLITLYGTQKTGKTLIDPATNTILWTQDELADAIEFYGKLVDNHVVQSWKEHNASGVKALHEDPMWTDGRIAGTYQWDTTYFKISDPLQEGQELVYAKLLTQPGEQTEGIYRKSSMVFSISKNSKDPKAAAEILNCLLVETDGVTAMGSARGVPSAKSAQALLLETGILQPIQIEAQDMVVDATGPAIHPYMEHPDVRSAMEDNLELYAYGEIDAQTAAEEMIYAIEEVLEDI